MKRAIVLSLAFLMVISAFALVGSAWGNSITIAPVFEARAGPSDLVDLLSLSELDSALFAPDETIIGAEGFFAALSVDGSTELEVNEYLFLAMDEVFAIDAINSLSGSSEWVFLGFRMGNDRMFTDLASATMLVVLEDNIDYAPDYVANAFSGYYWLKESAVTDSSRATLGMTNSAELTGYPIIVNWVRTYGREVLLIRK